ncbi:FtsX-like permease family protein [Streptomyces sp. NPDC046939]|uniref:FtsX-like permease family protein n=1 Tax=Streptomyces sp. NPDC046939 TaxID=3155376 RepID=UPI0033F5FD60
MNVFDIAWSTIKHRRGGFVAAFLTVLLGSAVVTACGVLLVSGLTSGAAPERYAGATVMVGGQQTKKVKEDFDPYYAERVTVPAALTEKIAAVDGVERVIGDRTVEMNLIDETGRAAPSDRPLYGHGWASAALGPFELAEGERPDGPRTVVLDAGTARRAGLAVGDTARLAIGTDTVAYKLVGLVKEVPNGLERQSAAFFSDERAARLTPEPDRFTAIGVLGTARTSADDLAHRVEQALAGAHVTLYTGQDIGDLEFLDVGASRGFLIALSASFGGTALAVVVFVVSSTLGLAIHQRRQELAMLRAVAASPRQIHRLIGSEVLLVSVTAAVAGAVPGFLLAHALRDAFAKTGVLPADFELSSNPAPAALAVLLCVLGTRLAGFVAAFRTARIKPVEALQESQVEPAALGPVRRAAGLVLIALGLVAALVLPMTIPGELAVAGAAGSLVILMVGAALTGPHLVGLTARALGPLLRRSRVSGYLAWANTTAHTRRLSSAVVPLALCAAMALLQLSTLSTVEATAREQAADGVVSDYVLTGEATGLSPRLTERVRALPGVEAADPVVRSQVLIDYTEMDEPATAPLSAQGVDPKGLDRTLDLDVREGGLDRLGPDAVALSWMAAGTTGLGVGDTARIDLGDGTRRQFEVVAIYGNGLGFGDVTFAHDLLARHTTRHLDTALLVTGRGDPAPLRRALDGLAKSVPTLQVRSPDAFAAAQQGQAAQQSWTNLIANVLLLLYVLIAVVNTLVMATAARTREFGMLRLIGAGRRQARRMMTMETCVVVAAAVVVGAVIALPPTIGTTLATTGRATPHIDPLIWLSIAGGITVLAWLSISIPTRSALRTRPVEAVAVGE